MANKVNAPCHCGSGKKYKKCCLREDQLPPDERGLLDPGPVPQHVKDDTDKMAAEEGYTAKTVAALTTLDRLKTRQAAARRLRAFSTIAMVESFRRGADKRV